MARFDVYNLVIPKIVEEFNEQKWVLRDKKVEEKIAKLVAKGMRFNISETKDLEYKMTFSPGPMSVFFCFSQMEGNCNGIVMNHYATKGTSDGTFVTKLDSMYDVTSFLMKNLASLLGDNMILISDHKPRMEAFVAQDPEWKVYCEMPSNRGYDNNILYAYCALPVERMASTFGHRARISTLAEPPAEGIPLPKKEEVVDKKKAVVV